MNSIIVAEAFGIEAVLASSSFIANVADGLRENGATVRVVVATSNPAYCVVPSEEKLDLRMLFGERAVADVADAQAAVALGLPVRPPFSDAPAPWFITLRLVEQMRAMGDEGLLLFYPRDAMLLAATVDACAIAGWHLGAFATEEPSGVQIDSASRASYLSLIAEKTDFIWASSQYLSRFWQEKQVDPKRIFVNYSVVPASRFALPLAEKRSYDAVFIGNFGPRYVDELLAIASAVREQRPAFSLIVYGDAHADARHQVSEKIERYHLGAAVTLANPVSPAEIPSVVGQGRVLLAPVAAEYRTGHMAPHKIAEYLASGGLVVASSVGDLSEMFVSGRDLYLAETREEFVADVLAALALPEDEARALRERGRAAARPYVDATVVTAKLLQFISGLEPRQRRDFVPSSDRAGLKAWIRSRRQQVFAARFPRTNRAFAWACRMAAGLKRRMRRILED